MNDRERRTLARIERQLAESDPQLARMLRRHRHPSGSNPILLLAIGLATVMLGAVTVTVPLVLLGMVMSLTALGIAALGQNGFRRPMAA